VAFSCTLPPLERTRYLTMKMLYYEVSCVYDSVVCTAVVSKLCLFSNQSSDCPQHSLTAVCLIVRRMISLLHAQVCSRVCLVACYTSILTAALIAVLVQLVFANTYTRVYYCMYALCWLYLCRTSHHLATSLSSSRRLKLMPFKDGESHCLMD
jgi:hypothetical protein